MIFPRGGGPRRLVFKRSVLSLNLVVKALHLRVDARNFVDKLFEGGMVSAKNLLYNLLGLVVLKDGLPKFLHAFISLSFSFVAVD